MIHIENLTKHYSNFTLQLSFDLPEGKVSGLVGKNGAGKSTTIKSILGLVKKDSGTLEIFGKDIAAITAADKEDIGVALSDSGFSGYLTVESVISILKNMYHRFDEQQFRHLCQILNLPLNKKIKEFSTGMKAKLRVITAITHNARLLIMDEPTSGLDIEARNEILDMLRDYLVKNDECSILITSHISSDLEGLCDDIYLIHDGRMIIHEDTDNILEKYGLLKVDAELYDRLDKSHILSTRKESFGYSCFTDEKQYYRENYPGIVIEKGSIDDLILMMTKGER
ncbi:MAG: ABC transporter ATP-binding protein [Erysipelotrichaceae bacterium]|nr:ABC transporter ATP-binding protein [Erysipelotrichaceae bacterium]